MLEKVNYPEDIRSLSIPELQQLSSEIRAYIIDVLASSPGHLASGLGVVELTVALHHVFNTPDDKLVWDVGHQAYPHKILTGRKDKLRTIRTYKGLSGFPKMEESPYDAFGTGHSSTSISAALGMAIASSLQGNTTRQHIAIIGDGSMTGGMAFEALNNAAEAGANLLVILNDNGIAISKSVGALSEYFTKITVSKPYNRFKNKVWNLLGGDSGSYKKHKNFLGKILLSTKIALLKSSNIFESLKFRYFGPIDGHNVEKLVAVLSELKDIPGAKLLHIVTKKGKGLSPAEIDPVVYHAPGAYNPTTGEIIPKKSEEKKSIRYQEVFGETILRLAETNPKIVGITPAMLTGSSLDIMMKEMPERVFDVGIAEQHAVTFAAGLASQGMLPFCNIYSSFMQRAYDQVIHDVALQNLPVVFCLDRAGLVGEDGATHQGAFDLAYFRSIPNLIISSPLNGDELQDLMYTAQSGIDKPFVIRFPRNKTEVCDPKRKFKDIPIGKGTIIRKGADVAIVTIGPIGNNALKAAELLSGLGIEASIYNMRFLKPIDEELLHEVFKSFSHILTIEDGTVKGGLGSEVVEFMHQNKYRAELKHIGIPDRFIEHGSIDDLYKECGMDLDSIVKGVQSLLGK